MKKRLILPFLVIAGICLGACKKYEDGPVFSLRSKKERVANNWKAGLLSRNNLDELEEFSTFELDFSKGGSFEWRVQPASDSTVQTLSGNWEFAKVKESIKLTYAVDSLGTDSIRLLFMDIRRLKEDEMWLEYLWIDDQYFVQLVPR
ncbi:MAG: hypothetical protein AAFR66_10580 [Bacteroidota bacterium]